MDVFKTSRYEKSKQLGSDDYNEHSIESAVDRSKRYLKTYRERNDDSAANSSYQDLTQGFGQQSFRNKLEHQFPSQVSLQHLFKTQMQKRRVNKSNYQSVDSSQSKASTTKVVIEYVGTPLQVLFKQRDLEYKMRALNANEKNIFKYNQ